MPGVAYPVAGSALAAYLCNKYLTMTQDRHLNGISSLGMCVAGAASHKCKEADFIWHYEPGCE